MYSKKLHHGFFLLLWQNVTLDWVEEILSASENSTLHWYHLHNEKNKTHY